MLRSPDDLATRAIDTATELHIALLELEEHRPSTLAPEILDAWITKLCATAEQLQGDVIDLGATIPEPPDREDW